MSIFKESFKPGIRSQLEKRQEALYKRDLKSIQYLNSRTSWVRMTSAVQVGNDSNNLAKDNVLLGGALYAEKQRSGVGGSGTEAYSIQTPSGKKYENTEAGASGIRPMPGITGIEVTHKGAYGSLREVKVSFNCWNIQQLEDLELLYMRPGYTVLVEWGWMPYLDNNGELSSRILLTNDVLNAMEGSPSQEEILKTIYEKSSGGAEATGNYDAMYGKIKQYSWSARPDGGYDCSTTIISMGEIIESLKVNFNAATTSLPTKGIFNTLSTSPYFLKNGSINKSYSQNVLAGILHELWAISVFKGISNLNSLDITLNGEIYNFFRYDIELEGGTSGGGETETFVNDVVQIYIPLKDFISILNKYILLSDGKKPIAEVSVTEGIMHGTPGNGLLCLGNIYQISTDPSVCQIKNPAWKTSQDTLGIPKFDSATIESIMTNLKYDYFKESKGGGKYGFAEIGNIYVNLGYLYSLVTDDGLASQDPKDKKEINLYDFLKSMMNGINNTIGNVANFDIHVDPLDSKARIIDVNYIDEKSRQDAYNNAFVLQMHNLKGTVRSYKLESQIFPEQSAIVAIGSQIKGGAGGTNSTTLVDFNQNLKDRVIPQKDYSPALPNNPKSEEDQAKNLKTNAGLLASYLNKADPSWYEHAGEFDVKEASKYANALRDIINYYNQLVKNENRNRAIIPTTLSIELDGIGGIIIGSLFRIPDDLLPRGYKGIDGIGAKIGYLVTRLGHSVQNNDWITKIEAQFIVLDNPLDSNKPGMTQEKWAGIIAETIEAAATSTPPSDTSNGSQTPTETKTNNTPVKRPTVSCKDSYSVVNSTVAPKGVPIKDVTPWAQVKTNFPIKNGPLNVLAIGTPYDSESNFAYKMKNIRVNKRKKPANYIVLHYTVSDKKDPTHHYRSTWEKNNSADFAIGRTGLIAGFKNYKNYYSWHYGEATWPGGAGFNNESIGFEIESLGYVSWCKSSGKFFDDYNQEVNAQDVCFTSTYRGHNMWHAIYQPALSAVANLIIAIYNDGGISDKATFITNCKATGRYNILWPDYGLKTKPSPGIITHGTGRPPSGKVDIFPQANIIGMLDDLPTLIKNNPKTYINWTTS